MLKISEITSDLLKTKLSRKLRNYIGRGLRFEYTEAAEILDIDQRTLESYVGGHRAPMPDLFIRLFALPDVGAAIANEVLSMVGLEARPATVGDPCPHQANARVAYLMHRIAERLADGRIDHREDPEHRAECLELAQWLIGHVNARDAGNVTPITKGAA